MKEKHLIFLDNSAFRIGVQGMYEMKSDMSVYLQTTIPSTVAMQAAAPFLPPRIFGAFK